jgi:hypothetical protein
MSRAGGQAWVETYDKDYCRSKEYSALKAVHSEQDVEVQDTPLNTRKSGTFLANELKLDYMYDIVCALGISRWQVNAFKFQSSDLDAPTLQAPEARLLAAFEAEHY